MSYSSFEVSQDVDFACHPELWLFAKMSKDQAILAVSDFDRSGEIYLQSKQKLLKFVFKFSEISPQGRNLKPLVTLDSSTLLPKGNVAQNDKSR